MLLAIDAGNTRIKWGLFDDNGDLFSTGACPHDAFTDIALPDTEQVIIASVVSTQLTKSLFKRFKQPVTIAKVTESCGDLINDYADITRLGVDRWAAAVAAWTLTKATCLIANAGTAITVDAIKVVDTKPHYIGGWIAPGLHTMQQSLAQNTAQLEICDGNQAFDTRNAMLGFGLDTQTSIKNGTMAAAIGMIHMGTQTLFDSATETPKVIISGGDGKLLSERCEHQGIKVEYDEHLVLKGLLAVHHSNNLLT